MLWSETTGDDTGCWAPPHQRPVSYGMGAPDSARGGKQGTAEASLCDAASQSQMFNKHHRDQRVIGVGQVAGASPVIFDGALSFGRRSVPRRGHNHNRFLPNRGARNVFSFCRNPFYFDLAARMFSVIV